MAFLKNIKTAVKELSEVAERINTDKVSAFVDEIVCAKRIFLVGVGREGLSARGFAMRLAHCGKSVFWAWDDTTPAVTSEDTFIVVSGSGEIGHIHYVAETAKKAGASIAVVTGTPNRKTPQLAKIVLHVPAAVYKGDGSGVASVQPMGSLFEQSLQLVFDSIILEVAERLGVSFEDMTKRHRNFE